MISHPFGRRHLIGHTAAGTAAFLASRPGRAASRAPQDIRVIARPLPLADVRLLPSPWLEAVESNRHYLLSLDPDRLLHNFRKLAGLAPKGALYGGWENDTISGHTLGHYLSALSLMHAQTGDTECHRRVQYIVDELATVQARQGDGYVAGFTRKGADGTIEDGKLIFAEIERGDIRSGGFDLNGAWSPLYNVHKTFAGLLDAEKYCGAQHAIAIAEQFAAFFETLYARLSDSQLQQVLACEYGGLNESFADLAARTGKDRWLALARRTYDRQVLDPLGAQEDDLPQHHANTQIPKLIGMARIAEVGKDPREGVAPRFFWDRVVHHHSFVIGGNADREYFFGPDMTSQHLTEQTCEHCNSYNMLKLTRHIYGWNPDAAYFDYYERTHLNHILAAHDPSTGMFTYMTPMLTAGVRDWSSPTEDFWCCVGTGMESHARHGESIWWETDDTLFLNLYIPSRLQWHRHKAALDLKTRYPYEGEVALAIAESVQPFSCKIALRVPGWVSGDVPVSLNGNPVRTTRMGGYLVLDRTWTRGDVLTWRLPMTLRTESPVEDKRYVTLAHGPMLLAADLAPAEGAYNAVDPALVSSDLLADFRPVPGREATYITTRAGRPGRLTFVPFYAQYRRRSALYLQCFSADEWATQEARFKAEQTRTRDITARTVDVVHLGEMQPEHDHGLTAKESWPVVYRNRNGRDIRRGGFITFSFKVKPGPLMLQTTFWEQDIARSKGMRVLIDGQLLAEGKVSRPADRGFVDYVIMVPKKLTLHKKTITVRFESGAVRTTGPLFGVRLIAAKGASPAK